MRLVRHSNLEKFNTSLQSKEPTLNVAITHSMLLSVKPKHNIFKSQNENLHVKIHDIDIDVVQNTKYFGVQIDSSLDWKEDIKTVSTKFFRIMSFQNMPSPFN